jgi:hypothetical protein
VRKAKTLKGTENVYDIMQCDIELLEGKHCTRGKDEGGSKGDEGMQIRHATLSEVTNVRTRQAMYSPPLSKQNLSI